MQWESTIGLGAVVTLKCSSLLKYSIGLREIPCAYKGEYWE